MKKLCIFLLLNSLVSLSAMSENNTNNKKRKGHEVISYYNDHEGYTPAESLIETIELGHNEVQWFVERFGPEILKETEPYSGLSILQKSLDAKNTQATKAVEQYLLWYKDLFDPKK